MDWISAISYIALIFSIFPLIIGLVRRHHFNPVNKAAFYVVLCTFFADWLGLTVAYFWGFNWFLFPFTTALYAIPVFYYLINAMPKKWKSPLTIGLVIYILIQLSESLIFRSINDFNGITSTYLSLVIGITAIFGMIHIKQNAADISIKPGKAYVNVFNHPSIWFMLGLAIFYGANIVNNAFSNLLISHDISKFFSTWGLHSIILIVYRTLFTIGLWKVPTTRILAVPDK